MSHWHNLARAALFGSSLLVTAACGGKVHDPGNTVDSGTVLPDGRVVPPDDPGVDVTKRFLEYCDKDATRAKACGETPHLAECKMEAPCVPTTYRTDALLVVFPCLETRACGTSEKVCVALAGTKVPRTTEDDAYFAACNAKLSACGGTMSPRWCGDSSDIPVTLLKDDLVAQMRSCFSSACGGVDSCIMKTVEARVSACSSPPTPSPEPTPTPDAGGV